MYRDENTQINDVALTTQGTPYLAGHELGGRGSRQSHSRKAEGIDQQGFRQMDRDPVDYRAEAHRAYLAIAEDRDVWVATDTGMILKLQND